MGLTLEDFLQRQKRDTVSTLPVGLASQVSSNPDVESLLRPTPGARALSPEIESLFNPPATSFVGEGFVDMASFAQPATTAVGIMDKPLPKPALTYEPEEPTGVEPIVRNAFRNIIGVIDVDMQIDDLRRAIEFVAGTDPFTKQGRHKYRKYAIPALGEVARGITGSIQDWNKVLTWAQAGLPVSIIKKVLGKDPDLIPEHVKESLKNIGRNPLAGPLSLAIIAGVGGAAGKLPGRIRSLKTKAKFASEQLVKKDIPSVEKGRFVGEPLKPILKEVLDFDTKATKIDVPFEPLLEQPTKTTTRVIQKELPLEESGVQPVKNDVIHLNKADKDIITKIAVDDEAVRTLSSVAKTARDTGAVDKALGTAEEVIANKRPITDVEQIAMNIRLAELAGEHKQTIIDMAGQVDRGSKQGFKNAEGRRVAIEKQIDILKEGARFGKRENARGMRAGGVGVDVNTYDLSFITQRSKATKGKKLTQKQDSQNIDFAKEHKKLDQRVKDFEAKQEAFVLKQEKAIAEQVARAEDIKAKITSRTQRARQRDTENRESIKKQLAELGMRVNDVTGITPEAAHLVGKLGVSYIKSGVTTLEGVVKRVLADLPELTKRDIYKALNTKDPKVAARIRSKASKQVGELKKQAQLLLDIEKAEQGIFKQPSKSGVGVSLEVRALQNTLKKLRKQAYETVQNPDKLASIVRKINDINDQLDTFGKGVKGKKGQKSIPLSTEQDLLNQLADVRKQLRTKERIADLEHQLETGEFKINEPKRKIPDSPELLRSKAELSLLQKKIDTHIQRMAPLTVEKVASEVVNALRTVKATGDVSAIGRQGFVLGTNTNPRALLEMNKNSLRAAVDPVFAEMLDIAIKNDPDYYLANKSKLHFTEHQTGNILAKEELFMSDLVERTFGFGKIVRASNRHMVTYLNQLRMHNFKRFVKAYPNATHAELTAWANIVNVWSGRGNLGSFAKAANILSLGLFAPRFAVSRVQTPFMMFRNLRTPNVRKFVIRDSMRTFTLGSSILLMAHELDMDVEMDPASPDWGKIKVGNTRVDIWGGLQQPMRVLLRIGLGKVDDPLDTITRFSQYKVSPLISVPREFYTGKTAVGEPVEPTETAARLLLSFVEEDVIDAYKDGGLERAILSGGLNAIGVSANTYRSRGTSPSGRRRGRSGGR